jgi:hypothetical protein
MKEKKIIESISHTEVKNILYSKVWIEWRGGIQRRYWERVEILSTTN